MNKRLEKAWKGLENDKRYSVQEAVSLMKGRSTAKFDESVDVAVVLNVDPRKTDQVVRGSVSLPNGTGKTLRVAVFAKDLKAEEARNAGADLVGAEDLLEEVLKGNINFDRCVATTDIMHLVMKASRILGPRGMMPSPKMGTVTMDVASVIKELKAGRVDYRTDKAGIVHAAIGKASFDGEKLAQNLQVLLDAIAKGKPAAVKKTFCSRIFLTSTMGPSVALDMAQFPSLK